MASLDAKELHAIIAVAFKQWAYIDLDDELFKLWFDAFKNETGSELRDAVVLMLKRRMSDKPPQIAEVQAALDRIRKTKSHVIDAAQAWGLMRDAIARFGYMREHDAITWLKAQSFPAARTCQLIGWQNLCRWEHADEMGNRSQFWKIFNSLEHREETATHLGIAHELREKNFAPTRTVVGSVLQKIQASTKSEGGSVIALPVSKLKPKETHEQER